MSVLNIKNTFINAPQPIHSVRLFDCASAPGRMQTDQDLTGFEDVLGESPPEFLVEYTVDWLRTGRALDDPWIQTVLDWMQDGVYKPSAQLEPECESDCDDDVDTFDDPPRCPTRTRLNKHPRSSSGISASSRSRDRGCPLPDATKYKTHAQKKQFREWHNANQPMCSKAAVASRDKRHTPSTIVDERIPTPPDRHLLVIEKRFVRRVISSYRKNRIDNTPSTKY